MFFFLYLLTFAHSSATNSSFENDEYESIESGSSSSHLTPPGLIVKFLLQYLTFEDILTFASMYTFEDANAIYNQTAAVFQNITLDSNIHFDAFDGMKTMDARLPDVVDPDLIISLSQYAKAYPDFDRKLADAAGYKGKSRAFSELCYPSHPHVFGTVFRNIAFHTLFCNRRKGGGCGKITLNRELWTRALQNAEHDFSFPRAREASLFSKKSFFCGEIVLQEYKSELNYFLWIRHERQAVRSGKMRRHPAETTSENNGVWHERVRVAEQTLQSAGSG